jgi:acetyl-CoA carboxylase carboxyl transferase beta subunit
MLPKYLFGRPRNTLEGENKAADALIECAGCKSRISVAELAEMLGVCRRCGAHTRIAARKRIAITVDPGSFEEIDKSITSTNLLGFPEYEDKLAKAKALSGEAEGVLTGTAAIDGQPIAIFAMDPNFMMGSMGTALGEKVTRLFELATQKHLPVVGFTLSGGARVQEGILSLMQMAKTSGAVERHSRAGLLYIAVMTDPTTGGVDASFATLGDILIAEPKALIGFAGPRVIEQTIRQKLPAGFQRAEFQLEKGFVDIICDRRELRSLLSQLISLHQEVV